VHVELPSTKSGMLMGEGIRPGITPSSASNPCGGKSTVTALSISVPVGMGAAHNREEKSNSMQNLLSVDY